jgi:hypothetical protein
MLPCPNFEPALGQALTFDGDDLAANRAGKLSHRQIAAMRTTALHAAPQYHAQAPFIALFFASILALTASILYITNVVSTLQSLVGATVPMVILPVSGFVLAVLAWIVFWYRRAISDFAVLTAPGCQLPQVRALTGHVTVQRGSIAADGIRDQRWYLIVANEWIVVSEQAQALFHSY